jgi:peptidyl-prolyl cis-trans isomerase B (cyclophilin B)
LLLLVPVPGLDVGLPAARAEDPPPTNLVPWSVPRGTAPTLDGRLDDPAWGQALGLEADPLLVPPAPPGDEPVRLVPDVRLLEADGRLWIGVAMAEDPGTGIGLRVLAGPDALPSAADAVSIGYAPQELRATRIAVRGPRGVTRAEHYPVVAAADTGRAGAWSLELALPLAALDLGGPGAVMRLALAVTSRAPNLASSVPVGGLFGPPQGWLRLEPAAGAWSTAGPADPSFAATLRAEDAAEDERLAAWREFLQEAQVPNAPGVEPRTRETYAQDLLAPLATIQRLRPDLTAGVEVVRGDVLQRLGRIPAAVQAYGRALEAMPGCREAAFQRDVRLRSLELSERPADAPSDFAVALAEANAAGPKGGPYAQEGARLALALLRYKQGDLAGAIELLEPLARRFPAEPLVGLHLERARATLPEVDAELKQRAQDDARADLPRLTFTTSRGVVEIELFEDHAPNSVRHVVWLAEQGFYDGTTFHANVPFFALQGGDPFTRAGGDPSHVGAGSPGYAIPEERSPRPALRGTFCLVGVGSGALGCQFMLAHGTAVHLKESVSAVGRVVAGQEVADRLVLGDRLEKVAVTRRRPGTTYRPTTVAGEPAPAPVATSLLR